MHIREIGEGTNLINDGSENNLEPTPFYINEQWRSEKSSVEIEIQLKIDIPIVIQGVLLMRSCSIFQFFIDTQTS